MTVELLNLGMTLVELFCLALESNASHLQYLYLIALFELLA